MPVRSARLHRPPLIAAHFASTTVCLPFSTMYVASSTALPLPGFFAEWTAPAGMNSAFCGYLRGANAARISLARSSGSSHAAKWPPLSTCLK